MALGSQHDPPRCLRHPYLASRTCSSAGFLRCHLNNSKGRELIRCRSFIEKEAAAMGMHVLNSIHGIQYVDMLVSNLTSCASLINQAQ